MTLRLRLREQASRCGKSQPAAGTCESLLNSCRTIQPLTPSIHSLRSASARDKDHAAEVSSAAHAAGRSEMRLRIDGLPHA